MLLRFGDTRRTPYEHAEEIQERLPGVSVLARQVSEARTAAEWHLYEAVVRAARRADSALVQALAQLLEAPEGKRVSERERLTMLPQLEKAARILAKASKILTEELDLVAEHDADLDVAALWAAVEEAVPRTAVAGAVATVEALVPEDGGSAEAAMWEKPALRCNTVRPFLSLLGEPESLSPVTARPA